YLAYYSAPAPLVQQYLFPVYVYRAFGTDSGKKVVLRTAYLPATQFKPDVAAPPAPRSTSSRGLTPPARTAGSTTATGKAGASWLDDLDSAPKNVCGFIDGLQKAGWTIGFNRSGAQALKTDWLTDADTKVNTVDIVFYTGHAAKNGWFLRQSGFGS